MNFDSPAALAFLTSFAWSAASLRLGLASAGRLAMATPVARSSHTTPIPQSGGLFVMAAVTVALVLSALVFGAPAAQLAWLSPALSLAALGWLDDRRGLPAALRLVAYALVSGAAVLSGLVAPAQVSAWPWLDGVIAGCCLVAFVNVTNFMDGIDGMVVVAFAPLLLCVAAVALVGGDAASGVRALAALGGLAGFFIFNRPKARIFLGDCGSVPLGFLVACLLLDHARAQGVVAALILPLYFLADTSVTLARRVVRRERIWEGHRQHFYQKALDGGHSNWSILARVGACNVALCALSLAASGAGALEHAALLALGCGCVALLLRALARGAP